MIRRLAVDPLKLKYDDSDFSLFEDNRELVPNKRRLAEMKEVVFDKNFYSTADKDMILYYMYRNVCRPNDGRLIEKYRLRYDITIVPSLLLGEEYIKTVGHHHPIAKDNLTYTEIYEVLSGKAHYLLQKLENGKVVDVVLVKAKEKDKVSIPPNYGHITINPSKETLIMANWVSCDFNSTYELIREKHGGAYFELVEDRFLKNEGYTDLPSLRIVKAEPYKMFPHSKNLYTLFLENPKLFGFLNHPEEYFFLK